VRGDSFFPPFPGTPLGRSPAIFEPALWIPPKFFEIEVEVGCGRPPPPFPREFFDARTEPPFFFFLGRPVELGIHFFSLAVC